MGLTFVAQSCGEDVSDEVKYDTEMILRGKKTYFVVSQHNGASMYVARFLRWIVACHQEIRLSTSVLLPRILLLSLLNSFCRTDDSWTRRDRC